MVRHIHFNVFGLLVGISGSLLCLSSEAFKEIVFLRRLLTFGDVLSNALCRNQCELLCAALDSLGKHARPDNSVLEHWARGPDSPGWKRSSGAGRMIPPAGMVRGRWQWPPTVEVGGRRGPCSTIWAW